MTKYYEHRPLLRDVSETPKRLRRSELRRNFITRCLETVFSTEIELVMDDDVDDSLEP